MLSKIQTTILNCPQKSSLRKRENLKLSRGSMELSMNLKIRPVRIEDAEPINEIRRQDGVRENTMGIISERITRIQNIINNLTENDHMLVAEIEENGIIKVVGAATLSVNRSNRVRHSGSMGISVHKDYTRQGHWKSFDD